MWRRVLSGRAAAAPRASGAGVVPGVYRTPCGLYVDRTLPKNFDKILIANRGEIACRVMRTARELGVKTVAVYSEADADAMHVRMADEAYLIGPALAKESYLKGDTLIEVARRAGAQAIHPGYGFLSENEHFAKLCADSGVEFIGPPASAISAMGSKSAAKEIMSKARVPVVPGYHGEAQDLATLRREAERVGYPIMIKAVLGGGGKGMRIVLRKEELEDSISSSRREALNSFKDDRVLLERYIQRPRHIEFQIFADKHGNAVHLFERDCSVQRRHQKVLEEAPAPGMTGELRHQMGKAAVDAAKAVGYVGAGTVEFIFDADTGEYFFMEMNTRLQVEHCVSEMIARRDFVQLQLHVAAGHKLPFAQEDVDRQAVEQGLGHAIEARVYAENPRNNFLPATGHIHFMRLPRLGPNSQVRVETGVRQSDTVSVYYDPMIAKVVAWAPDRERALGLLNRTLADYQIVGPVTNIDFLQRAIAHRDFAKGQVTTGFIAQHLNELVPPEEHASLASVYTAALSVLLGEAGSAPAAASTAGAWDAHHMFRVNGEAARLLRFKRGDATLVVEVHHTAEPGAFRMRLVPDPRQPHHAAGKKGVGASSAHSAPLPVSGGNPSELVTVRGRLDDHRLFASVGGRTFEATVAQVGNNVHVFVEGQHTELAVHEERFAAGAAEHGSVSPMAGRIVKVAVKAGDTVKKGAQLIIMEAMKMEHVIRAARDGVVAKIVCGEGDVVEGGKTLVLFQADEAATSA